MMKTDRLTPNDKNALKAKHRLELIMEETGERFQVDPHSGQIWRSITTPGLTIDIGHQRFELIIGSEKKSGDIFSWLKHRYAWSFPQAIRYLQKRPADPESAEPGEQAPAAMDPSAEKQENLKPRDRLQERALEIAGEKMMGYLAWPAWLLEKHRDDQPHRFEPIQDMTIQSCDECEERIDWWWKQEPEYEFLEFAGLGRGRKRVRVIYEPQVYVFECEEDDDKIHVCEKCKRKMINFREALDLLYRSAHEREAPQREQKEREEREAARAEMLAKEREERELENLAMEE